MNRPSSKYPLMSLDDFEDLLADQPEDERWELIGGRVVRMMVGARWEHNVIVGNLGAALDGRFRAMGSPCRALRETFRLKRESAASSLFPDLLVFCQRPAPGATFLTDATIIVEVMSQGTQRRDREDKWAVYQTLPSLRHYVLVARDAPHIERIDREADQWSGFRIAEGLEAHLELPGVGVVVPLAEIYADVLG